MGSAGRPLAQYTAGGLAPASMNGVIAASDVLAPSGMLQARTTSSVFSSKAAVRATTTIC